MIRDTSFDYWVNSGYDPTKGDRQRFIDALPTLTKKIKENIELTHEDKRNIYDGMNFVDDIDHVVKHWDGRLSLC